METITKTMVQQAIAEFLSARFDKKTGSDQKKLATAKEKNEFSTAANLEEQLHKIQIEYSLDVWMEQAANRMTAKLYFGTHISRGIHPDSQGDNIFFQPECDLPEGLVASQHLEEPELDANGNAANLPLAAFFDWLVDEKKQIRIRHLIMAKHPALEGVFATDAELSAQYQHSFRTCLLGGGGKPATYEKNKQIFWPVQNPAGQEVGHVGDYVCLVPLYPSAFNHEFHHRVNELRYSEANKKARENRYKAKGEQQAYVSIPDVAVLKLGGSNTQNVGKLNNQRGGRNALLPSLPPRFSQKRTFRIARTQKNFFNKRLYYHCKTTIQHLFAIVKINYKNVDIRDARKAILDSILNEILMVAATLQQANPPGWTRDLHGLGYSERLWLDPGRSYLEGEEEFAQDRLHTDWRADIATRFGNWLNDVLKDAFKQIRHDFGDAEQQEWIREMEEMIKQSQRKGLEVFL